MIKFKGKSLIVAITVTLIGTSFLNQTVEARTRSHKHHYDMKKKTNSSYNKQTKYRTNARAYLAQDPWIIQKTEGRTIVPPVGHGAKGYTASSDAIGSIMNQGVASPGFSNLNLPRRRGNVTH